MRSSHKYSINLRPLAWLELLHTLHIAQLVPEEGASLGLAIRSLKHLEDLRISAASPQDTQLATPSLLSPLDCLLEALYDRPLEIDAAQSDSEVRLGFPASLKSLFLIDCSYRYDLSSSSSCLLC